MRLTGPVVHVTTVHPRDDVRIFHKECASLARAGFEVVQVVGDGRGDAVVDGVRILDIGAPPPGRIARMRAQPRRAWTTVERLGPALVHVHDPELLPLAARAASAGCVAIYDAHEDLPRQILTKQWIPAALRSPLAWAAERRENALVRRMSAVVATTPHIARRFAHIARRVQVVANFPVADELAPPAEARVRERAVVYVGGIMRMRGAFEMVRAVARLPGVTLNLAGPFEDDALRTALCDEPGWARVRYHGVVGRAAVRELLARSAVGLVTLLPMPSYLDALPVKMFEYMSAGLPVLASDFPHWRELLAESGAGRCVDPLDVAAIARAIEDMLADPAAARAMGERGRQAVLARFHWAHEERKLVALYRELLP